MLTVKKNKKSRDLRAVEFKIKVVQFYLLLFCHMVLKNFFLILMCV